MDANGRACPVHCPCLCHDTQGGVHAHHGTPCSERTRDEPEWDEPMGGVPTMDLLEADAREWYERSLGRP